MEADGLDEFAPIPTVTTNVEQAVVGADLILIVVPAYGQRTMLELCTPHLRPGQALVLLSGSLGSLEAVDVMRRQGLDLDEVLLGETVTLPLAARKLSETRLRLKAPYRPRVAGFPGRNGERLKRVLDPVFDLTLKPNVLETGLNNPNFIVHPAPMLLNHAAVDRADGRLSLLNEGMTTGAMRLMDAVDAEKMALQKTLDLEVISIDDLYRENGAGPEHFRGKGENYGVRDRIWDRYVTEDVPYGTVMFSSLGRMLGVPTRICDAINTIFCALEDTDVPCEGRTAERLGINGMDRDGLLRYVETGERD